MNTSTMLRVGLCLMVVLAVLTTRAATSSTTPNTTDGGNSSATSSSSTVSPKKNLATSVNGSNVIMTFACFVAMVYRLF